MSIVPNRTPEQEAAYRKYLEGVARYKADVDRRYRAEHAALMAHIDLMTENRDKAAAHIARLEAALQEMSDCIDKAQQIARAILAPKEMA
jgi:hypothetical protein